jgi:hypothetical protein
MIVMAIDPGNIDTAYVLSDNYIPLEFAKTDNKSVRDKIIERSPDQIYIEMIASYGMGVGKEVFETCVEIGRLVQIAAWCNIPYELIYRKDVKLNLCGSPRAKDSNVIQALKDRFGDKGTKANKGFFFGFSKDVWQAYAVLVTGLDKQKEVTT